DEYVVRGVLVAPGSLPFAPQIAWFAAWLWIPAAGSGATFLPLLFPDGRLLSPRWRPAALLSLVAIVMLVVVLAFYPGPIQNVSYIDNPFAITALDVGTFVVLGSAGFVLLAVAI